MKMCESVTKRILFYTMIMENALTVLADVENIDLEEG